VSWQLVFTIAAEKDSKKLLVAGLKAGLKDPAAGLLSVIAENPVQNSPPYEKLVGDLAGAYLRRINI